MATQIVAPTLFVPPLTNHRSPRKSVYEIITNQVIAELEKGAVPWRKPWCIEPARNLCSGKPYRGINVFLLGSRGYSSPWWLTYRQAIWRGGHVRKGEKGSTVVFWKWDTVELKDEDGNVSQRYLPVLRYYAVFNAEQCEGIAAPPGKPRIDPITEAECIAAGMRNLPCLAVSPIAAYCPKTDTVLMPPRQSFESAAAFYSTLFHELVHSTGHTSRLARPHVMDVAQFGSEDYSKEELVAEMGAAMLCGIAGIESQTIRNFAGYIEKWLSRIKGDSRLVVSAASQAQKAADYMLGKEENQ